MKKTLSVVTLCVLGALGAKAAVVPIDLDGNTSFDGWASITSVNYPGRGGFPGGTMWAPLVANVSGSGDAAIAKISNGGPFSGAFPASSSLYYGGTSGGSNVFGGVLAVQDQTPVSGLQTIVFQIEIGEATGYDFYNHELPVLSYTTSGGTVSNVAANFSSLIDQVFSGTFETPSGTENIYTNTWGLQWDLSGVTDILSFSISWAAVEHAQVYAVQLNQSDTAYSQSVLPQSVPEPSTWVLVGFGLGSVVFFRVRKARA